MQPSGLKSTLGSSDLERIDLPRPALKFTKRLARIWQVRKTIREISDRRLPLQTVSNLLWAAFGVNRERCPFGMPGRTAAAASNSQEIDVYVALARGTYLYDPGHHELLPAAAGDLRPLAIDRGQRTIGDAAPIRLIYCDRHRPQLGRGVPEGRQRGHRLRPPARKTPGGATETPRTQDQDLRRGECSGPRGARARNSSNASSR